ncbi:S-adenosyl-L-methionine-dependent methyltransferase [Cladochytrium replicatum]|nr:S-adenosyl-L-methionine-dependent methyltransferase [Cladochytrium replicatum]
MAAAREDSPELLAASNTGKHPREDHLENTLNQDEGTSTSAEQSAGDLPPPAKRAKRTDDSLLRGLPSFSSNRFGTNGESVGDDVLIWSQSTTSGSQQVTDVSSHSGSIPGRQLAPSDRTSSNATTSSGDGDSIGHTLGEGTISAAEPNQDVEMEPYNKDADDGLQREQVRKEDGAGDESAGVRTGTGEPTLWKMRLRVSNLPKYASVGSVTTFVEKLGFTGARVKKAPNWSYAFVEFKTEEEKEQARLTIAGKSFKSNVLEVEDAPPPKPIFHNNDGSERGGRGGRGARGGRGGRGGRNDRLGRKGGADENNEADPTVEVIPSERLADQVTPLWRKTYDEQLNIINRENHKILVSLKKKVLQFKRNKDVDPKAKATLKWIEAAEKANEGLPCELLPVVGSPIENYYRNKCEFTIGRNQNGEKTVGFLLGLFKDGITSVHEPTDCLHVSVQAKAIAAALQKYIRESPRDVYDRITATGFWRAMIVRTQTTNEVMVIVQINPSGINSADVESEKLMLSEYLQAATKAGDVFLTTILIQVRIMWGLVLQFKHRRVGKRRCFQWVLGQKSHLFALWTRIRPRESLWIEVQSRWQKHPISHLRSFLRFRISPTAFFQVNTPSTENLYNKVREWCALDSVQPPVTMTAKKRYRPPLEADAVSVEHAEKDDSPPGVVLLDLCCGTGTIGLTMASSVKKVIGVEMIAEAIEDAKFNAQLNDIENVEYICGKVEDAMRQVLEKHVGPQDCVVAVMDPPRAGVPASVIRAVRDSSLVTRVIYISCEANLAMQNFVDLCRPPSNKYRGPVFRPIRAQPFDLFPHTPHCELVIAFERERGVDESEAKASEAETGEETVLVDGECTDTVMAVDQGNKTDE